MSDFSDYKDSLATESKDLFLGQLVFYTVSALTVSYDAVKAQLEKVGLADCMPKNPPADSDIFRRVFLNGERRRVSTGADCSQRLLVREVSQTSERLIKRIVAEDVDGNNVTLSYTEVVELTWNKNHPDRVTIDELAPHTGASELAVDLAGSYVKERGHLDGNAIRAIIQRAFDKCHATSVREGGAVYFVSSKFDKQIEALETIGNAIPGCVVHSLPLVDNTKQRGFITDAFKAEATTDVQAMLSEVNTILRAGEKVTPRKFNSFQTRFVALKSKAKEYERILKTETAVTDIGLESLTNQMEKLFSSVTIEKKDKEQ